MSAAPGWYKQPDGRETYWDGQGWLPGEPVSPAYQRDTEAVSQKPQAPVTAWLLAIGSPFAFLLVLVISFGILTLAAGGTPGVWQFYVAFGLGSLTAALIALWVSGDRASLWSLVFAPYGPLRWVRQFRGLAFWVSVGLWVLFYGWMVLSLAGHTVSSVR